MDYIRFDDQEYNGFILFDDQIATESVVTSTLSFEVVTQKAIYEALISNVDIIANSIPVYDAVPQAESAENSQYPYITIGEDNHLSIDTDTENENQVSITINVWSRQRGRLETKTIQGYIYKTLQRAELSETGYKFVNIMQDGSTSFMDVDGITRHGVQTFNLIIQEL